MAFSYKNSKGQTCLNSKDVTLKSTVGSNDLLFSKDERDTALNEVPSGKKLLKTKELTTFLKESIKQL